MVRLKSEIMWYPISHYAILTVFDVRNPHLTKYNRSTRTHTSSVDGNRKIKIDVTFLYLTDEAFHNAVKNAQEERCQL